MVNFTWNQTGSLDPEYKVNETEDQHILLYVYPASITLEINLGSYLHLFSPQ